ncbi:MAG TPA: hypothetical protein VH107_00285 [Lacipirellulaceae bacterium]|nr:hypothetical protein [Lacipirellulaceae bacterium]
MGLLLVPLLLKKHALLDSPSLCFNTIVSKRSAEYRKCLTSALTRNDWNEWFEFFLRTIIEAAELAIDILQHLTELIEARRCRLLSYEKATISAMQLENLLRRKPVVTVATVTNELLFTDPTARGAIKVLCDLEILRKVTKGRRNRVFADVDYLTVLGAEEVRRSR